MTTASQNVFAKIIAAEGAAAATPAAGTAVQYVKTDGRWYSKDDAGVEVGPFGGASQSFVGYNTVGGTWTAMVGNRQYAKKITLAAAATFTSIDVYLRANTDNFTDLDALLLSDAAGVPDQLIGSSASVAILLSSAATGGPWAGRWVSLPMGAHVAAGDYWIVVRSAGAFFDIANDGSGSDVTWNNTAAYVSGSHSALTQTTGSVKYSIRASILA